MLPPPPPPLARVGAKALLERRLLVCVLAPRRRRHATPPLSFVAPRHASSDLRLLRWAAPRHALILSWRVATAPFCSPFWASIWASIWAPCLAPFRAVLSSWATRAFALNLSPKLTRDLEAACLGGGFSCLGLAHQTVDTEVLALLREHNAVP